VAELIADIIVYFALGYWLFTQRASIPGAFRIAKKKAKYKYNKWRENR
jgi:hypothetical protein